MTKLPLIALVLCALPMASLAQEETASLVPLRIEIVVSRAEGERSTHALHVTANRHSATQLRHGQEVAVPGAAENTFQYRNVGTNIQCRAKSQGDKFLVWLNLEQSSVAETTGPTPSFQTFNVFQEALLADGQSVELSAASNDIWNVSLKLDVLD